MLHITADAYAASVGVDNLLHEVQAQTCALNLVPHSSFPAKEGVKDVLAFVPRDSLPSISDSDLHGPRSAVHHWICGDPNPFRPVSAVFGRVFDQVLNDL